MRSLGYAIACAVLLAGPSVQAQAVNVTGTGNSGVWLDGDGDNFPGLGNGMKAFNGYGGSTEANVTVTQDQASFKSGVAVSGFDSQARSMSGVNVSIINTSEGDTLGLSNFHSTIIPAGMGFYLQDRSGDAPANIFTDYGQTFAAGWQDVFAEVGAGAEFARVGFHFDVYGDGFDGGYDPYDDPYFAQGELYSLSGYVALSFDANGNLVQDEHISDAQLAMPSFQNVWEGSDQAFGYAWDDTEISLALNKLLEPGQQTNLYYRTSVYAETSFGCLDDGVTCLAAYSGFGDPIGRGGGINLLRSAGPAAAVDPCGRTEICGIVFDPQTVKPFTFDVVVNPGAGVVPEPSTWAIMLLGFGMLGAALRRRRLLSYS